MIFRKLGIFTDGSMKSRNVTGATGGYAYAVVDYSYVLLKMQESPIEVLNSLVSSSRNTKKRVLSHRSAAGRLLLREGKPFEDEKESTVQALAQVDFAVGKLTREVADQVKNTTNNRMELLAVLQAIRYLNKTSQAAVIFTDSQYVQKGITDWMFGWRKHGWTTASNKPVKNVDMWKKVAEVWENVEHNCKIKHVKGHSDVYWNEHVDTLSRTVAHMEEEF